VAVHIDDVITKDFTVHNPLTGAVSDADFLPTCEVYEDTTDVPMLTPAVVKRVGHTGDYRVTFTTSIANGFELNKSYNVIVQATVAGVTAKARIASFNIESTIGIVSFKV